MVTAIIIYLVFGLVFAIAFFAIGYRKIDSAAATTPWLVRLMWTPAALAIWPILLVSWVKSDAHK